MDDAKFDRVAQAFSRILTRRRTMAFFGAAASVVGQRVARGAQVVPATCSEEGAACTLTAGCCEGLTCVTSAINTSYGVCVPGEGGMVSTGTTLVSPFSESAVDEATALLEEASTAPATDPFAERDARIADAKARKDARLADRRARLDARRTRRHTPNNKNALDGTFSFRPLLRLTLTTSTRDGNRVDTVEATNRGDTSLVLTRIASLLAPEDGTSLTTDPSKFTLTPGESYFFVAGKTVTDATEERFDWTDRAACDEGLGAGYVVEAALTVDSRNRDFEILCEKALGAGAVETASETPRRNRQRNAQHQKKKR